MRLDREGTAALYALGAVLLWSTAAAAFKLALVNLHPLDLLIIATVVSWLALGAALLSGSLLRRRAGHPPRKPPSRRDLVAAAALGLLNPVLYYWVLFTAYKRLPAQIAQPLNYTWPLFLALLALPIAGKKPRRRDLIGIAISIVGVILIARSGLAGDTAAYNPLGLALALGSGIIWALYWLAGNTLRMAGSLRLFIGFSAALLPAAILWRIRGSSFDAASPSSWAALWVGLFEMGLTFLLWNGALERSSRPARIGSLVYLGPFISLVWIALLLGERIRPATVAGLVVIVVGILVSQGGQRRNAPRRDAMSK